MIECFDQDQPYLRARKFPDGVMHRYHQVHNVRLYERVMSHMATRMLSPCTSTADVSWYFPAPRRMEKKSTLPHIGLARRAGRVRRLKDRKGATSGVGSAIAVMRMTTLPLG